MITKQSPLSLLDKTPCYRGLPKHLKKENILLNFCLKFDQHNFLVVYEVPSVTSKYSSVWSSVIHQSICLHNKAEKNSFSSKNFELTKKAVPARSARMLSQTLQLKSSYPVQERAFFNS